MKRIILIIAIMVSGMAFAQVDKKASSPETPVKTVQQGDTISTNTQIQKDADMKTMDAVKTQDHPKTSKTAKPDSLKTRKKSPATGTGKSTNRP